MFISENLDESEYNHFGGGALTDKPGMYSQTLFVSPEVFEKIRPWFKSHSYID